MTNEKAIKILSDWDGYFVGHSSDDVNEALDKAIKALEQQSKPIEKFDDVKTHIQRLAGDYKCWDNRLTWEEALELNRMLEAHPTHGSTYGGVSWGGTYKEEAQPNSNEFFNFDAPMVKKSDAVSREAVIDHICEDKECYKEECKGRTLKRCPDLQWVFELPPVTPQRPKGKWIKTQSGDKDFPESIVCSRCKNENSHLDFDEHSEPIGKVFVTSKYCPNCGAEMGGADETN